MTAAERLRQLLDERGVVYSREGCETFFKNVHIWAINDKELCISISGLSPEQAVEATLGRGTCDMEFTQAAQFGDPNGEDSVFDVGMFRCTACGTETYGMWNDNDECREWPRYCPSCGRRVES